MIGKIEKEKCAIMSRIIISLGSIQQQATKPETETTWSSSLWHCRLYSNILIISLASGQGLNAWQSQ